MRRLNIVLAKNNCEKGRIGEKIAVRYLENRDFDIIALNYRTSFGEIDIIAKDKEYIVFIEVKFRNNLEYGYPREAVGKTKQKNIIKTAYSFISENNIQNMNFRFDVIEVCRDTVNYIENAFWDWN
ncbi:MAG: YraN family protein [Clostridiales bacterium]|nr:YraN family protein [Clostridiales bacterium]